MISTYLDSRVKAECIKQGTLCAKIEENNKKSLYRYIKSRVRVFVLLTAAVMDCLRKTDSLCFSRAIRKQESSTLILSDDWP